MKLSGDIRKRLLHGSAKVLLVRIVGIAAGLLWTALLARQVSPSVMGAFFLAQSVAATGAIFARFGTRTTALREICRFRALSQLPEARYIAQLTFRFVIAASLSVSVIWVFFLSDFLFGAVFNYPDINTIAPLIAAWIALISLEITVGDVLRAFSRVTLGSFFSGVATNVTLALLLLVVLEASLSLDLFSSVTLACLALIMANMAGGYLISRDIRGFPVQKSVSLLHFLAASAPIFLTNLISHTSTYAGLWIIGAFLSGIEVAFYGAAFKLALLILMPLAIAEVALGPLAAELTALRDTLTLQHSARAVATLASALSGIGLMAFVFLGESLLRLLYGEPYVGAYDALVLLGFAQFVSVFTGGWQTILIMLGEQKTVLRLSVLMAALSLALCLLFVQLGGYVGVVVAIVLSIISKNVIGTSLVKKRCGFWTHAYLWPEDIRSCIRYISAADGHNNPRL